VDKSLGHGIKSLGDGVQTGGGAEGDIGSIGVSVVSGISIRMCSISKRISCIVSISVSISRSLAKIVSVVGIAVCSIAVIGDKSLGHGVKSLGDGVETSGRSKGNCAGNDNSRVSISGSLAKIVSVVGIAVCSIAVIGDKSLGHGVKSLGDGVETSGRSKGNCAGNDNSRVSISGSLAKIVSVVGIAVCSIAVVGQGNSLGHGVKSLGDGVKTSGRSEGNCAGNDNSRVSISRSLAKIVSVVRIAVSSIALGHRVKSLGDGVQAGGRSKGNSSIAVEAVVGISISVSSDSSHQASQD